MKIKQATVAIILLSQSLLTMAQSPMTLKECMNYALQHSSRLEIQQADYDDAILQRRNALLEAFTPEIEANTGMAMNFGRAINPENNTYIQTTSFNNAYSINAGITLFDGLTSINRLKMAQTAVQMGLSQTQQIREEICLSVMEAYYKVIFEDEMAVALDSQMHTAQNNLELIQRQYELHQKSYADVAQTEAELAERKYQRICNRNRRNEALLNLKALMLWTATDSLVLDRSFTHTDSVTSPLLTEDVHELTDFACKHQASAQIARGAMQHAQYELRAARGNFSPTLRLGGGWSTNYYTYPGKANYTAPSFSKQFRNNGGEYLQLTLSIPIYSRLKRLSNLRSKKNECRRTEAVYRQTLRNIECEVKRALQDSQGSHAALMQAQRKVKALEEVYQLNQKQFRQGILSPIDFQTVSGKLLQAQADRLNALLQFRIKQSIVLFYKGISYLEQQH